MEQRDYFSAEETGTALTGQVASLTTDVTMYHNQGVFIIHDLCMYQTKYDKKDGHSLMPVDHTFHSAWNSTHEENITMQTCTSLTSATSFGEIKKFTGLAVNRNMHSMCVYDLPAERCHNSPLYITI